MAFGVALALWLGAAPAAVADVPAGWDLFQTDPVKTRLELPGELALPAGFLRRGSEWRRVPAR